MQIGTTQFPRTPQSNYNSRQIIHFTHQEASSHSILHMVQVLHNILRAQKSKQNYSNCGLKICLVHWMLQWPPGPGTKMWLPQTNADGTNLLLQSKMWLVTWKANAQLMHSKQKTNLDIYFSNICGLENGFRSPYLVWKSKIQHRFFFFSLCFRYLFWAAANAQIKVYSDHFWRTNGWQLIDVMPSVRNCWLSGEANWFGI